MKVKICPLCDSEMKKAHYCDACKSFIWRPEILDVHYNAEKRGLGEKDCAYGAEHDRSDHSEESYRKFSDALKNKTARKKEKKVSSSHEEVYGSSIHKKERKTNRTTAADTGENKRKAGGCLGKIILAIIILNAIVGSVGSNLFNYFTGDDFVNRIENALDEWGFDEDTSNPDDRIAEEVVSADDDANLDDQTAWDTDDICYFQMTKMELEELLSAWVNTEYGRPIEKTSEDIKQETTYVGADGNSFSVPQYASHYSMGSGQEYLIVYTDYETEAVACVMASLRDKSRARSFFATVAAKLDSDSGYDSADWENALDDLMNQVEDDYDEQAGYGYGTKDTVNMLITASRFADGEICITLEAMDYQ